MDTNQYTRLDPEWTYEETCYLFDMCQEYDLRWIVIHDRYDFQQAVRDAHPDQKSNTSVKVEEVTGELPTESIKTAPITYSDPKIRTIEDLKARFYDVGRKVLKFRQARGEPSGPSQDVLYKQMKYSKENEIIRKKHLEQLLARSPAEIAEEEALVLESRKLEAAAETLLLERAEVLRLLNAPSPSSKTTEYQTSQGLVQLTNQLLSDKSRKRKDPSGATVPDSTSLSPATQAEAATNNAPTKAQPQQDAAAINSSSGRKGEKAAIAVDLKKTGINNSNTKIKTEEEATTTAANTKTKKGKREKEPANSKKTHLTGSQAIAAAIHRKLSSKEEAAYGLSYHEKLNPGVYLRSSKITNYRPSQQAKIIQVLAELGIPSRPVMPTARVTSKFDSLQQSISVLLEAKKQADKLETEIKVLKAQKEMK